MDIEGISGPRVPDVIYMPGKSDELEPVSEKSGLHNIRQRAGSYEDLDRWEIEDRVTISSEARRKYKQMIASKSKKLPLR